MAQNDNEQIIIIKKIKKGGHGGHHGGSWKVAYADFVTAMMAFFLMMWLLNSTSSDQKESLAHYFREYSILSDQEFVNKPSKLPQKGTDVVEEGESKEHTDVGNSIDEIVEDMKEQEDIKAEKARQDMLKKMEEQSKEEKKPTEKVVVIDKEFAGNSEMANKIKSEIEAKLADIKDQIIVEPFKNLVRIEVIDNAGNPIFDIGSVEPTDEARKILKVIADSIKTLDVMLTIEGHTDARQYPSQNYTNWELSTGRASTFRIILGEEGVNSKRLISVSGLADTMPRIKEDPLSPFNRRVSILLYPKGQNDKNKVEQKSK